MHVTTVPQTLGFFRGQVGYLKRHGVDVIVATSPGPLLDAFAAAEAVPAVAVPMARRPSPVADLVSFLRLLFVVARHKPDIVHSHTPKAALLGTAVARLTARKAVLSVFGLPQMTKSGLPRRLLDATTRLECLLAHRVWCDSFSMRDFLTAQGLCSADKIVVLGKGSVNGVDAEGRLNPVRFSAEDRASLRRRWHIPVDALVVGFVGRIVRDKGIHDLAGAWQQLRARHPGVHLLLIGERESFDRIDPVVEASLCGDQRVHFIGQQEDVAPCFATMDVFVMPSYREGFGVTNIEAAAMALPVVSTRIPGCVDSVADRITGTLVPPRDAPALAAALDRYVSSRELRREHGEAGRRRVLEHFVPGRIWSELLMLYQDVAGRGRELTITQHRDHQLVERD